MTDEEYKDWRLKTYTNMKEFLANKGRLYDPTYFRNPTESNETTVNDSDYSKFKYTYLQPGQIFFFRSREKLKNLFYYRNKYTWVDYTGSIGKTPFLTAPPADASDETSRQLRIINTKLTGFFGEWLNFIKIQRPIKIIHFPVDYDGDILGLGSYTSNKEGLVKGICVDKQYESCADGYTLDFLWRATQERTGILKGINLQGFREMALRMESPEKVKLIGSTKVPVGMTLEEAKKQLESDKIYKKVYSVEIRKITDEHESASRALEADCAAKRAKISERYYERIRRLEGRTENTFTPEHLPGVA